MQDGDPNQFGAKTTSGLEQERKNLERQELEAPLCCPPPHVYSTLMLIYLIENDICQAKFLWKRIPDEVKNAAPELGRIWEIGKALFRRDPMAFHEALQGPWPGQAQQYIDKLRDMSRARYLDAVSCAYTSISLTDFSQYLGMGENEALALARQQPGWSVDTTNMILPQRKPTVIAKATPSEEKLSQLTDFIAFLEK